jgi:hypothetical protein
MAKLSSSMFDDKIFASEISVALYLLPAIFAGTGINVVSHILINHLIEAETRFERSISSRESGTAEHTNGRIALRHRPASINPLFSLILLG